MKVIACPNCNEQISNLATKCPHCGSLVTGTYDPKYQAKPARSGFGAKLLWIVILLALLGGGYYFFLS